MKGKHSFTKAIFQNPNTKSRKSVHFFQEAHQNVKNIISDILLTIDEEDKTTLNIAEVLQRTNTGSTNRKPPIKRVSSSKVIRDRLSSGISTLKKKPNFQTYLCSNQHDFFQKIADVVEEESSYSSQESDDDTSKTHINDSFNNIPSRKGSFIIDDINKNSKYKQTEILPHNDIYNINAHHSNVNINEYDFSKRSNSLCSSNKSSNININNNNNPNSNNANSNVGFFRFPSKKKEKELKSILKKPSDISNDKPNIKKSQRYSLMLNNKNILSVNFPKNQYTPSLQNNSSLGVRSISKKKSAKESKKSQSNILLTYDSDAPTFKSLILKKRKDDLSPDTPLNLSSNDDISDDTNPQNWYKRKKSNSNFNNLRRKSKVLNIEKQIRESFNLQQKKKQLREGVSQRLSVVLPQGIEREFDNFVTESNDDIYKYQTLCSELRISMMKGKRTPIERRDSQKSVKEFSLEQFQRLQEMEQFDIGVTPTGSKTCSSKLHSQTDIQSPLATFTSRSAVAAIFLNKEEGDKDKMKEKKHKLIQHKVTKEVEVEEELTEEKKIEKMRQKETSYRVLFKKNNAIYDSLSDQENEDEQLEMDHFYIKPDSVLRKILDGAIAVLSVLFIFFIPIEIAYIHIWENALIYFTLLYFIGEIIYIIDFILSFFMAYFDQHDNLIINKHQIRKHYITSWFSVDLITALPANTIINIAIVLKHNGYSILNANTFTMSHHRFVHCIKLFKIAKVIKICFNNYCVQSIINHVLFSKKGKSLLLYVTIIVFITTLHILTCLFVFFGYSNYPNWITRQKLQPKSYTEIYVAGLYFLVLTIVGVGYGDIVGTNNLETMYLMFLLIIGVLLYSWLVSTLSKIKDSDAVIAISERAEEIKNKFNILEAIRQSFPEMTYECYNRIQRYLKYNFQKELFSPKTIFDNLPVHLQRDLIFNMYKSEVENFIFFKYFENEDFIMKVLMCFQQNICIKNERIVHKGDFMDEMLFVRNGKLAIELPLPSEITSQLVDNKERKLSQYFNEYKFPWFGNINEAVGKIKKASRKKEAFQYVKLLEIHKNEHYGDIVMFLNKRSPLGVRVCTRKAELFYLQKADVITISLSFPSIWEKLITNSLFNMKQISLLIKKTLNYFYVNNKKILQSLISQNESYFDNMKNIRINVNPPDIDESNTNLKETEVHMQKHNTSTNEDDNNVHKGPYVKSLGSKINIISESSSSILRNNSDEGFLITEEQKGNLIRNSNLSANTNCNTNSNLTVNSTHIKSKFFSPNQTTTLIPNNIPHPLSENNTSILGQNQQTQQTQLTSKNDISNGNINTSTINNNTNEFLLSSRIQDGTHRSRGSILSPNFGFRHRESISKPHPSLPINTSPNILSTNPPFFNNSISNINTELNSPRSKDLSFISSTSSEHKQKEMPRFILNCNTTPTNSILIVNDELNHGETLVNNSVIHKQNKKKPMLNDSSSSEEEEIHPRRYRHSKLLSDIKLPTGLGNYANSTRKQDNCFTSKLFDEFKRNQHNVHKDNLQNSILEKSTSTKNAKCKKHFVFGNPNQINHNINTNKEDKKKKQNNFLSQKHLTQFDPFCHRVNCTPVLTKRRLQNKKGTQNLQQIKLEKIQSNIEQNQLNLKNPQMFYSEAFKEMINSKEKKKPFATSIRHTQLFDVLNPSN